MPKTLEVERRTLRRNLPRLMREAKGRFVLIHEKQVIDTFATEDDALRVGYGEYGPHGVFLIDEVGADEHPRMVTFVIDHPD